MTPSRRGFLVRTAAALSAVFGQRLSARLMGRSTPQEATASQGRGDLGLGRRNPPLTHGPILGDLTPHGVKIWARFSVPGRYGLVVQDSEEAELSAEAVATLDDDLCLVWELDGLRPGRRYEYHVLGEDGREDPNLLAEESTYFVTPAAPAVQSVTRLALASCAREDPGSAAVWRRISNLDPDALVLLGDTPYIDSTDLEVQRRRYGEFSAVPEFASLLRSKPLYATWDDHDFGANDSDGELRGKENSRRVFLEYRVNPSYGDGSEGVYTKFRMGGVEMFLIDARYFAGTEESPGAPGEPTLLGRAQWDWLLEGLRASTAPFKVLASGMIWNRAVRPGKRDHWETYPAEREALWRFIGEAGIEGVVLVGGDVHRTRVLRHSTTDLAGYPLTELITSPVHGSVIDAANAPHPDLVFDAGEPHAFMLLTVDTTVSPATFVAEFQNADGEALYRVSLDTVELSAG